MQPCCSRMGCSRSTTCWATLAGPSSSALARTRPRGPFTSGEALAPGSDGLLGGGQQRSCPGHAPGLLQSDSSPQTGTPSCLRVALEVLQAEPRQQRCMYSQAMPAPAAGCRQGSWQRSLHGSSLQGPRCCYWAPAEAAAPAHKVTKAPAAPIKWPEVADTGLHLQVAQRPDRLPNARAQLRGAARGLPQHRRAQPLQGVRRPGGGPPVRRQVSAGCTASFHLPQAAVWPLQRRGTSSS